MHYNRYKEVVTFDVKMIPCIQYECYNKYPQIAQSFIIIVACNHLAPTVCSRSHICLPAQRMVQGSTSLPFLPPLPSTPTIPPLPSCNPSPPPAAFFPFVFFLKAFMIGTCERQ